MKILLVEDSPVDRMFVTQSLRRVDDFEYELVLATSLADALRQLKAASFHVILLDLGLPDCEGGETCRRIVAAAHDVPVVVLTGSDDRNLATQAIRSGAQDYLVKGAFPGSAIVRVLQYAIDRCQFRSELASRDDHFRQILSHVPAIIWTTDGALNLTGTMGADMRLLDFDPQAVLGKPVVECLRFAGESRGIVQAHRRALEGESTSLEVEWQGRIFELRIDPMRREERQASGTIGIALDVTERRHLDREMSFARRVQEALLPCDHPQLDGFEIFGGSCPAKHTCGDWFDFLTFPDGSLGLVVGDVSGKGFGPAILSAAISAYLDVLSSSHSNLQDILECCDRLVCERELDGQFACLSIATLQPGVRALTYGGAGDGMLVIGGNGRLKHKIPSTGMPVGLFADVGYEPAVRVSLEPGDILLLLTDGFREACNRQVELFGEAGVLNTVAAHREAPASQIFQALRQAACDFASGDHQSDDMTGIVVKVL